MYAGLFRKLPAIVAELSRPGRFLPRSSRVYLIDPLTTRDTVSCVGISILGRIVVEDVPWDQLRHLDLGYGPYEMTARCWRDTRETMEAVRDRLAAERVTEIDTFQPDFGEWD